MKIISNIQTVMVTSYLMVDRQETSYASNWESCVILTQNTSGMAYGITEEEGREETERNLSFIMPHIIIVMMCLTEIEIWMLDILCFLFDKKYVLILILYNIKNI